MCAECDEVDGVGIEFFVDGAQIASDVYTAVSLVIALKLVIIEKRMKGIPKKQISSLFETTTLRCTQFPVTLFDIPV